MPTGSMPAPRALVALVPVLMACLLAAACGAPESPEDSGEVVAAGTAAPLPSGRVHVTAASDARAIEIAQATVQAMGGWEAWDRTRFLSWNFFGRRPHWWDRHTGDARIEATLETAPKEKHDFLWLMNVNTAQGRVWKDGEELAGDELAEALETGRKIWINDSYWLVMPFKLLDPGVTLRHAGERALEDGRPAQALELTFEAGTGVTPENRYEVFVADNTGLVEQWSFFRNAGDEEPGFTLPWTGWQRFGEVLIATDHGRGADWDIAVHESLPPSVFEDPAPVAPTTP